MSHMQSIELQLARKRIAELEAVLQLIADANHGPSAGYLAREVLRGTDGLQSLKRATDEGEVAAGPPRGSGG